MEIRLLTTEELPAAEAVVRVGFATVAETFHLTRENCPTNGAFLAPGRLAAERDKGAVQAGCFVEGKLVGYVQITAVQNGACEMEKLSVLPEARRNGAGAALVQWAKDMARQRGAQRLCIGIIEENAPLKAWYEKLGFVHTGTRVFAHLPFTVGFMEMRV